MTFSSIGNSAGGRDPLRGGRERHSRPRTSSATTRATSSSARSSSRIPPRRRCSSRRSADDVKMPIFIEANIHGDERRRRRRDDAGAPRPRHDATRREPARRQDPRQHRPHRDPEHESRRPRSLGTRANANGFDMNRDFLVQSQSEVTAQRQGPAAVARDERARAARVRQPDADRRPDEAAQPGPRVRHLRQVEPAAPRRNEAALDARSRARPARPATASRAR